MTGADLLRMINNRLMGYQGVATAAQLLEYANEGQDEVWVVLKTLQMDYFGEISQFLDPSQKNYFGPLIPSLREYTLPSNFRSIRFIEPLQQGYEQVKFHCVDIESPEWQTARRAANVDQSLSPTVEYFFVIYGKDQLLLAVQPEATMNVKLYYIRNLNDIVAFSTGTATTAASSADVTLIGTSYTTVQMTTMIGAEFIINGLDFGEIDAVNAGTQHLTLHTAAPSTQTSQTYSISAELDQLVDPYNEKIADFCVMKILLAAQDQAQFNTWKEAWQKDILALQTSASSRNESDPTFVMDFTG